MNDVLTAVFIFHRNILSLQEGRLVEFEILQISFTRISM